MKFFMIGPYYLNWHYTQGIVDLSKNLFNFIVFQFHFFSVKDLLLTLSSPFKRLRENYGSSAIDFNRIFSSLIVNIIMRIIGFLTRSVILIFAFISITLSLIFFPLILLSWILLPFILLILIIGSIFGFVIYWPK